MQLLSIRNKAIPVILVLILFVEPIGINLHVTTTPLFRLRPVSLNLTTVVNEHIKLIVLKFCGIHQPSPSQKSYWERTVLAYLEPC